MGDWQAHRLRCSCRKSYPAATGPAYPSIAVELMRCGESTKCATAEGPTAPIEPQVRVKRVISYTLGITCRAALMPAPPVKRRLAAILAADVAGYSRMV